MNVTCPNCSTIYRVDPVKVPPAGVRARCAVCAAIFPVRAEGAVAAPVPAAVFVPPPSPAPESPPTPPAPPPPPTQPAQPAPPPPEPMPAVAPVAERAPVVAPAPVPPAPAPMAPPAAPSTAAPARPAAAGAGAPPRPASPAGMPRPAGVPPRPSMPGMRPSGPVTMPPAGAAPPREGPPREGPPRRAGNPFLSQDPSQKARRLARALISDMVVYHPAKRREGLRDGNLKALFDEEIKKSWEEFTDQVGRDLAESTSHFKDALNEILADGRQLF